MPSNKDYVVRPKWNVEMESNRVSTLRVSFFGCVVMATVWSLGCEGATAGSAPLE